MPPQKFTFSRNFLNELELPVFVKNKIGVYLYCNESFSKFLGLPSDKIVGHTVYDIAPYNLAVKYEIADKALLEGSDNSQKYCSIVANSSLAETKIVFNKSVTYDSKHRVNGIIGFITNDILGIEPHNECIKKLTGREFDVLKLLLTGQSVKAMALQLLISTHTINGYLKSIYIKLDAHSKNEALYKAITYLRSTQWAP